MNFTRFPKSKAPCSTTCRVPIRFITGGEAEDLPSAYGQERQEILLEMGSREYFIGPTGKREQIVKDLDTLMKEVKKYARFDKVWYRQSMENR